MDDRPTFTVGGHVYDFIAIDDWTFEEADFAKAASGGMAPLELIRRLMLADGDALKGALLVSMRRVNERATERDLGRLKIVDVFNELFPDDEAGADARPPDVTPPDEMISSAATTRVSTPIPPTSGSPDSPTTSGPGPETSDDSPPGS